MQKKHAKTVGQIISWVLVLRLYGIVVPRFRRPFFLTQTMLGVPVYTGNELVKRQHACMKTTDRHCWGTHARPYLVDKTSEVKLVLAPSMQPRQAFAWETATLCVYKHVYYVDHVRRGMVQP